VDEMRTGLDVVWLAITAVLVFLMQPGFACLESGMVRAKNSINVAVKNLTDFLVAGIGFWFVGFALMFGHSVFGLIGIGGVPLEPGWMATFFFFQLMFCGTSTTIVSGAVAERMNFGGYIFVSFILSTLIYPVIGHWAWGGYESGSATGWLISRGFIDFAGSTVVHSVGGWLALAALLVIGPRTGRFRDGRAIPIEGHNQPLALLGVFLLWAGWFGFNAGSTLHADHRAISTILLNTMLAPCAGGLTALALSWVVDRKPRVESIMNGVLCGLVAVTAGCHLLGPSQALIIGAVGGLLLLPATMLLEKLQIDDAVGAIPVHLVCGVWGTIGLALLGDPQSFGTGLTRWEQVGIQTVGVLAAGAFALPVGWLALKLVNYFIPLRVNVEAEAVGLNVAEHGASTALATLLREMDRQRREADFSEAVVLDTETEAGQIAVFYNRVLERVRQETAQRERAVAEMAHAKVQAEQASQSKSRFLASMSHELRTPLNAILGFTEMMNQEIFGPLGNERYKEYVQDITSSGQHLLTLINDLLDLAKIEAHRFELQENDVDLPRVCVSCIRLVQPRAELRALTIEQKISRAMPALWGDERVIRQILLNLLSNAIKFTPSGGVITVQAEMEPDNRIAVIVRDTGVGMSREELAKAMEPFGQVAKQQTMDTVGTGLGLPITKGLVRLHGGTMVIASEVGQGTEITVRFPYERLRFDDSKAVAAAG
jgi:ammonium transporter, Amt family